VPNIQIYLHGKFHIFLRSLNIFPDLFSLLCIWKILWKKKKEFLLLGPNSSCRPSSRSPLSRHCQCAQRSHGHPPSARAPHVGIFSPKSLAPCASTRRQIHRPTTSSHCAVMQSPCAAALCYAGAHATAALDKPLGDEASCNMPRWPCCRC
jgi:hypothetical protein